MAIQNNKITEDELRSHRVQSAPDDLTGMATNEVKAVFDKLPELQRERYNSLIDSLTANTAAAEIGTASGESVQEQLSKKIISENIAYLRANENNRLERSQDGIHYAEVGSEGHIITDEESTLLPNRAKLRFEGGVTVEDSPLTDETIITAYYSDEQIKKVQTYTATHAKSGTAHTLTGLPNLDGLFAVQFKATASALTSDTWTGATAVNEISGDLGISFAAEDYISCLCKNNGGEKVLIFGAGATGAREVFALKSDIPQEQKLTEDTTVYVSPTGSDITGNGSQVNPWKSITHAQNSVPKNLGGHILTISVADGTYELGDKIEEISYFYAGEVVVEAPTEAIFNSNHVGESSKGIIDIRGCDYVLVKNITTKRMVSYSSLHGFLSNLSTVMFVSCKAYGIDATTGRAFNISASKAALKDCVIDNALWAISVNSIASGKYPFCHVSIATTTITNSNTGIVSAASLVFLTNVTNGATTKEFKLSGGQIWS